ncbi:MAG: DNA/RNA non-specific endonuclease [Beijerinckiaceae bacterium]
MAAPGNAFAFNLDVAVAAARRFRSETPSRERKLKAGAERKWLKVDTPARLVKRVNYLMARMRRLPPETQRELPPEVRARMMAPVDEKDLSAPLLERVINETRDFLGIDFLHAGITASRSVARIVTELGGGRSQFGTGFLVAPGTLMTNNHVLKSADDAARSRAEFDYQRNVSGELMQPHTFELRPDQFFLTDPAHDFTLVAVAPASKLGRALDSYPYSPLISVEGKIIITNPVNIVQHPLGEMKQIVVRENKLLDLPQAKNLDIYAHYEADTEPGSSGSPVFNDQWEIIALHHSSVPATDSRGNLLTKDGHAWRRGRDDPTELKWIANEGIRASRLVSAIRAAKVRSHEMALWQAFLATTDPNAKRPTEARQEQAGDAVLGRRVTAANISGGLNVSGDGAVTIEVPLIISISVGQPKQASVASPAQDSRVAPPAPALPPKQTADDAMTLVRRPWSGKVIEGVEEAIVQDPNFANRKGFDPRFLGVAAALPSVKRGSLGDIAKQRGGSDELKYHHYSVIVNKRRRLAFVSAVNLDLDAKFAYERTGSDKWFFDPRVGENAQAGNEFYADNPLDRGHLTRRADAAWGKTEAEAKRANDDTFHWTNCSPQHEVFNQSTRAEQRGLLLWGTLENHVADQLKNGVRKMSVFNGPIFRDKGSSKDRSHRGLMVPQEYWKVIAYRNKSSDLRAVAFVLSQKSLIKDLAPEDFEVGPYEPFQVRISDLEGRTNLSFGRLAAVDPLARQEKFEAAIDADGSPRAISSLVDVIL